MSRTCLFVLFLILGIAVRFSDCENNILRDDTNCTKDAPGSDKTRLSSFEELIDQFTDAVKDVAINIFSGSPWCNNIVSKDGNLGLFNNAATCCRNHYYCHNTLLAGETEVNLVNNGIFTRLACYCDSEFYNCLKNSPKEEFLISKRIGNTYFNILRLQCFQCICPTDNCNLEEHNDCKGQCLKYEWVDNPKF